MNDKKKEAINIAKQLGYSRSTISKIKNAKKESEITRALITARNYEL